MEISEKASFQLVKILNNHPGKHGLRIYIQGGGCSGFEYNFELATESDEHDFVFHHSYDGLEFFICVDELSSSLLHDATLDYKADLTGARFIVDNPNTSGQCSCGSSFSVG